jgi:hypothetical protein
MSGSAPEWGEFFKIAGFWSLEKILTFDYQILMVFGMLFGP